MKFLPRPCFVSASGGWILFFVGLSAGGWAAEVSGGAVARERVFANRDPARAELLGGDADFVLLPATEGGTEPGTAVEDSDTAAETAEGSNSSELDIRAAVTIETIAKLAAGDPEEFAKQAAFLRDSLLAAYDFNYDPSLERWYGIYRWLDLFQERPFHGKEENRGRRFGGNWPEELREFVLSDEHFTRDFFGTISADDDVAEAGEILGRLYRHDSEAFREFRSLALAVAVVYDKSGEWRPAGVRPEIQPPGLPDPVTAFSFFVSSFRAGRLAMDPRGLTPRELRFAVDIVASLEDLRWAQQRIRLSVSRFANAYSMITYDYTRYSPELRELDLEWKHADYRLPTIQRVGGICTDQAYFTSQVGKARGLPAMYFSGSGEDGGHAWAGYLEGPGKDWNLDVGRYEQSNYAVGHALDPQTWKPITDHAVRFESERFHRSAESRISRFHSDFAREFWIANDSSRALLAVRKAVEVEPRNSAAWDLAIEINEASGRSGAVETSLGLAAEAFRHYPHMQAHYLGQLSERMAERGDLDQAFAVLQEVSRRNRGRQADISVGCMKRLLEIARKSGDPKLLVESYRRTLSSVGGHAPGGLFLQELAWPYLPYLHERGETTQARILVNRTRQKLRPETGTLADRSLTSLEERLR